MILLDTSGLFAALNADQPGHAGAAGILQAEPPPLILSPFVLAELDYLVLTRGGVDREIELLAEIGRGAYELAPFATDDADAACEVIGRYGDLAIGLAEASIVVLAGRYKTNRVLTVDERHFRILRTPQGEPFTILPADA